MAEATMSPEQLRRNFFAVATERSQVLPRQNYADGAILNFGLPKAGFGSYLILDFQGTLTVGGAAGSIAVSPRAPYNLFKNVTLEDYLGITRISAGGFKLYQRDVSTKYGWDTANPEISQSYSGTLVSNSIGGGTGAAGSYPWNFSVIVPISLHQNTTEGSFPFTVPEGENVISIAMNTLKAANNDAVIKETTAGFTTTLTGTVGVTYYYWDVPKGTPLPLADFQLIHELREIKDATNLTAGVEKRYVLPTGRTYYQIIQDMVLNDLLDSTNISEIRFIIDGNTPTMDEKLFAYLTRTRRTYGRDFPPGMYLFDFWRKPWTPSQYGSLETGITLGSGATTTGNTYTSILLESMYRTNSIINA